MDRWTSSMNAATFTVTVGTLTLEIATSPGP